ncbi:Rhamnulokinase [Botrimarina colliarenosi]|uniref:Rhamnulokinase n=1 Tax=Botrimarina colliarenosi TaxID=2528001 RepID=A0A5C6AIT4_9BACT|nr:FGGY-family carbohydrate kinase [Botrimarina colliarenosi]TWT98153.1 Rhamnulokinase [Botrimarina colliarenosi]
MATAHIAIDLGASGGRAMLAVLDGKPATVRLEEAHRFAHEPLDTPAGPVWDLTTLWREILIGIRAAAAMAAEAGVPVRSIGCDTWGVDWALVEPGGELVGLPHAYRDPDHARARDRLLARIDGGAEAVYQRTGIPPQPFNTLFQVEARHAASPGLFTVEGTSLLLLPDLLHFWLSGVRANERTNASTTSFLSAKTLDWDHGLMEAAKLPSASLGKLVKPGTKLGPLRPELAAALGLPDSVEVVAPGTHDTASAVAAVPAVDEAPGSWAYLSSGTWSLLGVELDRPKTTLDAFEAGFTNEQGVGGRTRFLRNIAGLWLVQELRRDLEQSGQSFDYAQLANAAALAEPLRTLVDPNAEDLAAPGDSIAKLQGHARRTGQPVPESPGQLARCCFDSLALCYADTIERIEQLTDHRIATLYLVGGGVNNQLLNQLTADATGRTLRLGPSEATALGNALVQAMGLGLVESVEDLRAIVARSQDVEIVSSNPSSADWAAAKQRFATLLIS